MSSPSSEYIPEEEFKAEDQEYVQEYVQEQQTPKRKSAKGRKLVRWNPEKDQLVLLCVEYIVSKEGVDLDWNAVAKEVEPHLTGDAIKQHLFKLRAAREAEGQKNPPKLDRKAIVAARKKNANNPLIDNSKAPKTASKRRVKKAADDEDDDEEKPAPKTSGLLHLKVKKSSPTIPKKRKIKEESEDEMGCRVSVPVFGKKQKTNFPPPPAPPGPAVLPPPSPAPPAPLVPREERALFTTPSWDLNGPDNYHGGDVGAVAPGLRNRRGTVSGGAFDGAGEGDLTLPSSVGDGLPGGWDGMFWGGEGDDWAGFYQGEQ